MVLDAKGKLRARSVKLADVKLALLNRMDQVKTVVPSYLTEYPFNTAFFVGTPIETIDNVEYMSFAPYPDLTPENCPAGRTLITQSFAIIFDTYYHQYAEVKDNITGFIGYINLSNTIFTPQS